MEQLVEKIWNPYLLLAFLGVGLYLSLLSGFFQYNFKFWWKATLGQGKKKDFSQLSALFTALATTIGTGSIAGVATAIWFGGPGSIFWMWVSAFLGMMISACEKTLTIHHRHPLKSNSYNQSYQAGPMFYLETISILLAVLFSFACIFATLIGGNLVQSASIAQGLQHLFSTPPWLSGLVLILVVFHTLQGGMDQVGKINAVLVPIMATLYLGCGLYCLLQDIPALSAAIQDIFTNVFNPKSMVSGGGFSALRYGMARGIFSNEAGLGASAMAHGNAKVDHPARQGMWGILEVFFATIIVCTITGLVILTSGIYQQEEAQYRLSLGFEPLIPLGVPMTQSAFSATMGQWGSVIVLFSLVLFAFTSILGWSCYGKIAVEYLFPSKIAIKCYYLITMIFLFWGTVGDTETIWQWVDLSIAFMAIPNLIGLVFLAPQAISLLEDFRQKSP